MYSSSGDEPLLLFLLHQIQKSGKSHKNGGKIPRCDQKICKSGHFRYIFALDFVKNNEMTK